MLNDKLKEAFNTYKQIDKIQNISEEEYASSIEKLRDLRLSNPQSERMGLVKDLIIWCFEQILEIITAIFMEIYNVLLLFWISLWANKWLPERPVFESFRDPSSGQEIVREIRHSDKVDKDNNADASLDERVLKDMKPLEEDTSVAYFKSIRWVNIMKVKAFRFIAQKVVFKDSF